MEDEPPSYDVAVGQNVNRNARNNQPDGPNPFISYVDLIPACTYSARKFKSAKFERFKKANHWLRINSDLAVVGCETIAVVKNDKDNCGLELNSKLTTMMAYHVTDPFQCPHREYYELNIVKCLRLYVQLKSKEDPPEPHQIGYIDFIPKIISLHNIFSGPKFESYDSSLKKFNEFLKDHPIGGKILSIETVASNRVENSENTDESKLSENSEKPKLSTMFFRVFYLHGYSLHETIGSKDFIPRILEIDKESRFCKFENLSSTMARVQDWMYWENSLRVTNIQTINVCHKKAQKSNITERIDYLRSKYSLGYYFRIIRVYYVTRQEGSIERPFNLTYKTFVPPVLLKKRNGCSYYEPTNLFFNREIAPFIRFNSPSKVINYEVVPYFYKIKTEQMVSLTNLQHVYVLCIRVYFDGPIEEPPKGFIEPPASPASLCKNCVIL
ncbi:DgyrCDS9055 [Dimorphilus gyrociliatus]|uniref:DgyrCDS9055 n=1 Tax=Dimorphilus gyrociliatus TaxID=2664684 RepID=A0A7I8VX79_9ANNE|nr:DgyrCDS9055 [Dimorphilus gyrociliatus]